ncbi:hypothetical protein [Maribellus sp. YY47]|uniref:hypothetical protein n=1 Tax=Maribellus sp. YY47 TaxID=2929486 RepID=UPI0020007619|nr:hypothetical protein [Maribellus sp. YY47]MCK3685505.1 hypothetical protein [Maribellus sp. YY47]
MLDLSGAAACTGGSESSSVKVNRTDFELNETTVAELQQKMETGELTAEAISQKYLYRITSG